MTRSRFKRQHIVLPEKQTKEWKFWDPLSGQNTNYPRSIKLVDLDKAVYDWFSKERLTIDNVNVPTFFLTPEKWGEFKNNWKYMDSGHTASFPYVTIRRSELKYTESPYPRRIPEPVKGISHKEPVYTNAGPAYLYYKMPKPINVTLTYEVRILTHYMEDSNALNEILIRHFASIQAYLNIDEHYMSMTVESINDETDYEKAVDDERILHTLYSVKLDGFIIDESEFEEKLGVSSVLIRIDES